MISVKDSYHSISFSKEITINVSKEIEYGLYGVEEPGQSAKKTYKVTAPDYKIYIRSGNIIDAIGISEQDYIGGKGGVKNGVIELKGLSNIDIYWKKYPDGNCISALTFFFYDGRTSQTFGKGIVGAESISIPIPKSHIFQGFSAISTGTFINQISFLFVDTGKKEDGL